MSTNRLPPDYRDDSDHSYFENVIPFAERLIDLQESLVAMARTQIEPDLPMIDQKKLAAEYATLASFVGLLAAAAQKLDAEVAETGAALRQRSSPLNPDMRRHLVTGSDKKLAMDLEGYGDTDKADFLKQINAFVAKLREHYKLGPRQR
jgi:hypothetical protein